LIIIIVCFIVIKNKRVTDPSQTWAAGKTL